MTRVAIGLGSNVGDRRGHLRRAASGLGELTPVTAASSLYETDPVGPVEQAPFLNAVITLDASVDPLELLGRMQALEAEAGRVRTDRWGPRTLDLDLLLFGDSVLHLEGLEVPHPELTRRRFVLEPLIEVWPEATLPGGAPVRSFLADVADQAVKVIADSSWAGIPSGRPT